MVRYAKKLEKWTSKIYDRTKDKVVEIRIVSKAPILFMRSSNNVREFKSFKVVIQWYLKKNQVNEMAKVTFLPDNKEL